MDDPDANFVNAWRYASDREIRRALTVNRSEYDAAAMSAIVLVARERGIDPERPNDGADPHDSKPRVRLRGKYFAMFVTLVLWAITWPQILPADADLPPCHMMVLIGLSGAWTLYLFGRDRRDSLRNRL